MGFTVRSSPGTETAAEWWGKGGGTATPSGGSVGNGTYLEEGSPLLERWRAWMAEADAPPTFQPSINPRSAALASARQGDCYSRLATQRADEFAKREERRLAAEERRLAECTFTPRLTPQMASKSRSKQERAREAKRNPRKAKRGQERPKRSQERPKRGQEGPKRGQDSNFGLC